MTAINSHRSSALRRVLAGAPVALAAAALMASAPLPSRAAGGAHDIAAKLAYCQDCHGASGEGFHGYVPIPRLAGQQVDYIKNQLQAFIERRRPHYIMSNVAHGLSPAMIDALATDFHSFDPPPLGGAPSHLVAAGQKIFENGLPEQDIAACIACHGPNAVGSGQIPRLAGQLNDYIYNKLTNWSRERGQIPSKPDASMIMSPVAHSLNKSQVEAIAAYLNHLK
jgi:cytochrome c553